MGWLLGIIVFDRKFHVVPVHRPNHHEDENKAEKSLLFLLRINRPFAALCVAYRPDGREIAVATLDGQILMFDVETAAQVGSIEARRDLDSGRLDTDLVTREQTLKAK